ncbi:MAG TPA: hypothetical protein VGM30_08960 [Puia sp.]|jgi:hypothetical protein
MKKGKGNRIKWVHLRVSQEEYDLLQDWFKATTCRKVSELVRNTLFHRPIRVFYRNKSADEFLTVAIGIKNELNHIENNWNQLVKARYVFQNNEELSVILFGLEMDRNIMLFKADEIKAKLQEIYKILSEESSSKKTVIIEPILPGGNQAAAADQQVNKSGQ